MDGTDIMGMYTDNLLAVLLGYAPNAAAKQKVADMFYEAERDGNRGPALELILAQAIVDGLRHGNWPWTNNA